MLVVVIARKSYSIRTGLMAAIHRYIEDCVPYRPLFGLTPFRTGLVGVGLYQSSTVPPTEWTLKISAGVFFEFLVCLQILACFEISSVVW
ncbi:hypothetical protein AVEN_49126-1 [Araneus ventricosus]|uniref:Uncharacterized protein n=1 Tax=Araneus ventricosus TaxID=182803 RepID=A0A4Y2BZE0_ARAVE|nr:hypothetical protein AVEN_49126-1 [Araneus ventricosus]